MPPLTLDLLKDVNTQTLSASPIGGRTNVCQSPRHAIRIQSVATGSKMRTVRSWKVIPKYRKTSGNTGSADETALHCQFFLTFFCCLHPSCAAGLKVKRIWVFCADVAPRKESWVSGKCESLIWADATNALSVEFDYGFPLALSPRLSHIWECEKTPRGYETALLRRHMQEHLPVRGFLARKGVTNCFGLFLFDSNGSSRTFLEQDRRR